MGRERKRLGDVLIEAGVIYPTQLEKALEIQASVATNPSKQTRKRLGKVLMELGFLNELQMAQALAVQLGLPLVTTFEQPVEPEALKLIPRNVAEREILIPYQLQGNKKLIVAMADPLAWTAIDDLRFRTGMEIQPIIATESEILGAISTNYQTDDATVDLSRLGSEFTDVQFVAEEDEGDEASRLETSSQAPPIIRLVTMTIMDAIGRRASDIHIEPQEMHLQVRYRIDGELRDIFRLPKRIHSSVISRIKIIANMDIANRMVPQDGSAKLRRSGKEYDLRVSTLPAVYGEKAVIRVLDRNSGLVPLANLGVPLAITKSLQVAASRSQGMVLVTGPTGSGKTTTLYSLLLMIRDPSRNIVTIEDPVEYKIEGITQVPIKEKSGLGFAAFLRSALRQDPDVILVGEVRDQETADLAVRASLTGHLVLTSLHTNDSVATIYRLFDLGLQPYIISTALSALVAQRLVRKICLGCKEETVIPAELLPEAVTPLPKYYQGRGCADCLYTGYSGQVGVYEYFDATSRIKQMIADRVSETDLRQEAVRSGMRPLFVDAWQKVADGITTVSEVLGRVPFFTTEAGGTSLLTPAAAAATASGTPAPRLRTVLIADSEPGPLEELRGWLDPGAYRVTTVPPGMDSYEAVCRTNPDLVLIELRSKGLEALSLVERIKGNLVTATIPVVCIADAASERTASACLEAGAKEILRPPFGAALVSECVEKALLLSH